MKDKPQGESAEEEEVSDEEEETDESPEPKPKPKKFKTFILNDVEYKVNKKTAQIYLINAETESGVLGKLVGKQVKWDDGGLQHHLARLFVDKIHVESKAKHPDDQDLDVYKMYFSDCNADIPIIGESFSINMGGVEYEVTGEEFVQESGGNSFKLVVKYNGAVLPGLLFDID